MLIKRKTNLELGSKTIVMGILNVTPDSFSDGGIYYKNVKASLERVEQMISQGADIIDIGGESTRPGSESITEEEELKRVLPIIKGIRKNFGSLIYLSIDTYKSKVARDCLKKGANMVNSLGGFRFDNKLAEVVYSYQCPIVIYHIKGQPKTMQKGEIAYKDVIKEIKTFFRKQIDFGIARGIKKEQFILDPGIGFGKTLKQNLEIIKKFSGFKIFKIPLLIGVSRKSHLGIILQKYLKTDKIPGPLERLEAGLAEVAVAVLNGAQIIRTHDVLETKKCLIVLDAIKNFPKFYEN